MFNGLYAGKGAYTNERLTGNATRSAFSPRSLWGAIRRAAEVNPQVFVFSLWRTFGAFVALKIRYPNRKFVTFVHNERVANPIDRLLTAIMVCGADEIWVDSQATMDARLSPTEKGRARIISLRLERFEGASPRSIPAPEFAYWGRLAEQKRLDRSISLFARIAQARPDARLMLIGPDHGMREKLERQACTAGVGGRVEFHGAKSLDEITKLTEKSRFFLQLSDHEGMAMGVVEAMERGLVPVVTPVGQMGVYCRDGDNALVYGEEGETAERLMALMENPAHYAAMSAAAAATFSDVPIYVEDVTRAARELVG